MLSVLRAALYGTKALALSLIQASFTRQTWERPEWFFNVEENSLSLKLLENIPSIPILSVWHTNVPAGMDVLVCLFVFKLVKLFIQGLIISGGSTTTVPTTPIVPNSCRFQSPLGVIDLTTLGRADNLPAFLDVSPGPWSEFSKFLNWSNYRKQYSNTSL